MTHVLLRQRGPFLSRRHLYQTLKNLTTKGTPPGSDGGGVNIIKCHVARHRPSRIYYRLYCTSSGSNDDTKSIQNRNNTKSKQSGQSDINSTQSAISEPGSRSLSSEGHSEVEDPPSVLQNELKIVQNEKDVLVLQNKRLFEELQILKQLIEQANLHVPVPSGSSKSSDTSTAKAADAVVAKLAKDVQKKKRRTYDSKGNTEIELYRVMNDYLLTQKDLEKVPRKKSRSSVSHQSEEFLFRVTDVEKRAIEKWGSLEKMEKEKRRRERYRATGIGSSSPFFPRDQPTLIFMGDPNKKFAENTQFKEFIKDPSVSVIFIAVAINFVNTCLKGYIWSMTGSPSMFSETIHSAADTMNQMLLLYGQYWSKKKADDTHPYGFGIAKNVTALISGVFIFGVGAGGSLYHALIDYLHPEPPVDMYWSILAMLFALLTEGGSLSYAYLLMKDKAKERGKPFWQYLKSGKDPNVAVVLCEDGAAVLGVLVAVGAMAMTQVTGNPVFDTLGAFTIGGLLGAVSVFLIKNNTDILIQKSLPEADRRLLRQFLEDRPEIRSVQDVKATDSGTDVRFKAEVSFDGVVLSQMYVEQNRDKIRRDLSNPRIHTEEGLDEFMEIHGPGMLDLVGICIDKIEVDMKSPSVSVHFCHWCLRASIQLLKNSLSWLVRKPSTASMTSSSDGKWVLEIAAFSFGIAESLMEQNQSGKDPNVAVVLCEDGAAVLGVLVAVGAMAMTQVTGNPVFDTLGAFTIGGLLGAVSVFLIKNNTDILIQKSLPEADRRLLRQFLEDRPEIRSVQDVKATDSGTDVRFKAEVSFDGVVLSQMYVEQNRDKIRRDLSNPRIHTEEGLDEFMEIHGPGMLDLVGICIDKIEVDMKRHFNTVHKIKLRHVDLEPI